MPTPSYFYPFYTLMEASTDVVKYSYALSMDNHVAVQVAFSPYGSYIGMVIRNEGLNYELYFSSINMLDGVLRMTILQIENLEWSWLLTP